MNIEHWSASMLLGQSRGSDWRLASAKSRNVATALAPMPPLPTRSLTTMMMVVSARLRGARGMKVGANISKLASLPWKCLVLAPKHRRAKDSLVVVRVVLNFLD